MTTSPMPVGADPTAPANDNARGQAGVIGGDGTEQSREHTDAAAADQARKAWATVQARCTLVGFKADLIDGDDGRLVLVVSRWALTRTFSTPAEAEAWLQRVGAPR